MTPCKVWTGPTNKGGYGRVYVPGEGTQLVHRVVWAEAHGPIPPGVLIRHRCDNPPCHELDHLTDGTQADNMADAVERDRLNPPYGNGVTCEAGHTYTDRDWQTSRKGTLVRNCRACATERQRKHRAKKVGAAA